MSRIHGADATAVLSNVIHNIGEQFPITHDEDEIMRRRGNLSPFFARNALLRSVADLVGDRRQYQGALRLMNSGQSPSNHYFDHEQTRAMIKDRTRRVR